ncbi:uncharacterized protein [Dysidea avara]|uniref:uncharacterized protein isoform X2 n=1 Tax=Dysidea avara TaxID=196820 RepID=UPI0033315AE1
MSRKARKSDRRVFSSKNRAAVSLVLLTWTVSFSCGQQISKEYPICSTGDSSCGQTHCSEVTLQKSNFTSGILCINKNESFPLRYNIQGCDEGSYTQPNSSRNTTGVCLTDSPNVRLVLTVENLQLGKNQFTCFQNSQFISMTVIVFDEDNPYQNIVIVVNGEKRDDASDLLEGDNVVIVAQAVGNIGNIVVLPICTDGTQVTCTSNFLCNTNRYFEYSFSPVTLDHDGIVVTFVTTTEATLGNVTLHVRERSISTPVPHPSMIASTLLPPSSSILVSLTAVSSIIPTLTLSPTNSPSSMSTAETTTSFLPPLPSIITPSTVTSSHVSNSPTASPTGGSTSSPSLIIIIPVIIVVVIVIALVAIVIVSCTCYYWLKKQPEQVSKHHVLNAEGGIQKTHKVIVYPCGQCAISKVKDRLKNKNGVVITDLLNEPSVNDVITHLQKGRRLVICSCEGGARNFLQNVLDRRKLSPEEYNSWQKFLYLTSEYDVDSTNEMISRIPAMADDYDDIVKKILYELNGSGSSRGSTISSTLADQLLNNQHQIMKNQKDMKKDQQDMMEDIADKVAEGNEISHAIMEEVTTNSNMYNNRP